MTKARYLCKGLRTRFPDLPILVGLWNAEGNLEKAKERLETAGTNKVVTTFAQGMEQLQPLLMGVKKQAEPELLPSAGSDAGE